jgi:RimJ/RimL family protein N-acetyltransferase
MAESPQRIVEPGPAGASAAVGLATAPGAVLVTERLTLEPVTVAMVEAVLAGDRASVERLAGARCPESWPGPELIHRGFGASLEAVRANSEKRLWGDRLMITRDGERRVVGSVVFHGYPDADGTAEIGYGVETSLQGQGLATEATLACLRWALAQPGVRRVTATTFPFHRASLRVIEKLGMRLVDTELDPIWGERLLFGIDR